MTSRRPLILMAVLLVLLIGYFSRPLWHMTHPQPTPMPTEPLLPGKSSLSNLVVRQNESGVWQASFDYYSTGERAWIEITIDDPPDEHAAGYAGGMLMELQRGSHHATLDLNHPGPALTSRNIVAEMLGPRGILSTVKLEQVIEWPDLGEWTEARSFSMRSLQENLDRAVGFIDSGTRDELAYAKQLLERLIQRDASFEPAYIELARVVMKTNWGPEGWHHAEGLLSSALQLKPDSVNAKVLLGYVYTHQQRYKPAEKLFVEAAASNPPNIWLWANWAEMLAMQGKIDPAIAKYREAVARPVSSQTYERARADAYSKLLALLLRKKDLDGMEALYKKGMEAFGPASCHSLSYARFRLQQRGDAAGAIELVRPALNVNCWDQNPRETLGLAHYVAWSKSEGTARLEALGQARIYLPPGAKAMYLLASSETTVKAAAQLVSAGENIDNRDNDQLTALAHAVQAQDVATARRLLRLGASPKTPVGYGEMPVALMPVMSGNLELIKLMRQFGADYAKLSYEGATAFDFAKQSGDPDLLEALEPTPRTL